MIKCYSIIWDGSEANINEQINFVRDWTSKNGGRILSWKDKTIQERVCQYVGRPQTRKESWRQHNFKYSLETKYTIVKIDDSRIKDLQKLFGKKFAYTTVERLTYAVINSFDAIKHPDIMDDYNVREAVAVYGSEEEALAALAAVKLAKNTTKDLRFVPGQTYRTGRVGPALLHETLTTTHKATLKPWVVLDEEGLKAAGAAIAELTGSIDTKQLQERENELITVYNHNNDLCGRLRSIWPSDESKYDKAVLKAYKTREQAGRDLKEVRRELGKAKRQMTTAAKNSKGITYDLTKFAV